MKTPRTKSRLILAVTAALLATCTLLPAADWSQWRGPTRDGKLPDFTPPAAWPKQFTQKWKLTIGVGDSTPALVGDKLFAFGRIGEDEVITCINASDGKTLWQVKYPAGFAPTGPSSRHPGPRASVAVADGKVVTLGVGGITSCVSAADGKLLWRKQSTKDYGDHPYLGETSMSPLIADGLCYVSVGAKNTSAVFAFDLATGDSKWTWKSDTDGTTSSSPILVTLGGVNQLVTLTNKTLLGLNAADGKLLWQTPFAAEGGNNLTPVLDGQTIIIGGLSKGTAAFRIAKQGDAFSATQLWSNNPSPRFTTPILRDGFLYGFNGSFYCQNAQTGAVTWTDSKKRGNSAAIVDAGTVLLAVTVGGDFIAFKPDEKEYTELADVKIADTETWAHPVISGSNVFIRDKETVTLWTIP